MSYRINIESPKVRIEVYRNRKERVKLEVEATRGNFENEIVATPSELKKWIRLQYVRETGRWQFTVKGSYWKRKLQGGTMKWVWQPCGLISEQAKGRAILSLHFYINDGDKDPVMKFKLWKVGT